MEHEKSLVKQFVEKGIFTPQMGTILLHFIDNYWAAAGQEGDVSTWLKLISEQIETPYTFEIFHQSIRAPFDYYQFGLDFIRPLVDFEHSKLLGQDHLKAIVDQLNKGENVILLANHQIEPDPQIISLLIEKQYPKLAENMIFVAGHRVTTDPLAVPMSLGRNLLCIYSKKHIDFPPEEKTDKIQHNQRTMKRMQELLTIGGQCIYVAPSGGRDRPNAEGIVEVAPFDPDSLELFRLLAKQTGSKTHFYPLALKTFDVMPPPKSVEKEVGEKRQVNFSPVYASFGAEVDMEDFPGSAGLDKQAMRVARAEYICDLVRQDYAGF